METKFTVLQTAQNEENLLNPLNKNKSPELEGIYLEGCLNDEGQNRKHNVIHYNH